MISLLLHDYHNTFSGLGIFLHFPDTGHLSVVNIFHTILRKVIFTLALAKYFRFPMVNERFK